MNRKKHILSILSVFFSMVLLFNLIGGGKKPSVSAATSSEIKEELEELEARNEEIEAEIAALQDQLQQQLDALSDMIAQKDLVDQEISLLYEQKALVNEQIRVCSLMIAEKQAELDQAQARLEELQQENKERIRAMEENGELSYWTVLAGANSFAEMLDRMEMVREIAEADKLCLVELEAAAAQVASAKDSLMAEQNALQVKRDQMEVVEQQLVEKRVETEQIMIEMQAQGVEYEQMLEKTEDKHTELAEELAQKNAEYEEALDWEEKQNQASGPVIGGESNTDENGIEWIVPCTYWRMSSPFGYRYHPISGKWKMHNGVDLVGAEGSPIVATRSGYVTTAAYQAGGAGYYVSISHGDGYGSIYMHMTHYIVSYGQYVEAGQVIGYMGTTGGSTGVHLHFGISKYGTYVNPAEYINIV